MPSRKASSQGLKQIQHCRKAMGWAIEDRQWLVAASQILEPVKNWESQAFADKNIFASGVSLSTWKRFLRGERINAKVFQAFCQVLELDWQTISDDIGPPTEQSPVSTAPISTKDISAAAKVPLQDWGESPNIAVVYGRDPELSLLEQWVMHDRCQLIAILGMGGIGKTTLLTKLARQLVQHESSQSAILSPPSFDFVIWRSLLNAPLFETVLLDWIRFFSNQQDLQLPDRFDAQLTRLRHYLQTHRCLLILDNFETIFVGGTYTGQYRTGYEAYGQLLEQIGKVAHRSCLLLTSREKPQEIAKLEGKTRPVRTLALRGLEAQDSKRIFAEVGDFSGAESKWQQVVELYNGNPLALELAAKHIKEVFASDIAEFLRVGQPVFHDFRELIDWHFERLSDLEQEVVYWLAINRESISIPELKDDILSLQGKTYLPETLQSLQRKFPVETGGPRFTLQPVLMDYASTRLVNLIVQDICATKMTYLSRYALHKTLLKDSVQEAQRSIFLMPIKEQLIEQLGSVTALQNRVRQILDTLRQETSNPQNYAAGNLLNLLGQCMNPLSGEDFSGLTILQADLRSLDLHQVNLSNAEIAKSTFKQSFGIVNALSFSPDGQFLAAGDFNGEIRLWRLVDGQRVLTCWRHDGWVSSIAFHPSGAELASAGDDRVIKLWDAQTGALLKTFQGHTAPINKVGFSPDGTTLISVSDDCTIRLWDVKTHHPIAVLLGHTAPIKALDIDESGVFVTAGYDQTIKVWDLETTECLKSWIGHHHNIWAVVIHVASHVPDRTIIASGDEKGDIYVWDGETDQPIQCLQQHSGQIRALTFSPDHTLLASASHDHTLRLWSMQGEQANSIVCEHHEPVRAVAFNPNGRLIASSSEERVIKLWNAGGQSFHTFHGYTNWMHTVAFSPDGQLLASGSEDGAIRFWDPQSGSYTNTLQLHTDWVNSIAFSPDAQLLASGSSDQSVAIWHPPTGKLIHHLAGHTGEVLTVAFSPDSTWLASGSSDHTVRIWDLRDGQLFTQLKAHTDWVRAVAFDPKTALLATSGDDAMIHLWDVPSATCIQSFKAHEDWVWTIAFHPDGTFLASGSEDQRIKLWDIRSGECLAIFEGHKSWIRSVTFSPDGKWLASGSEDHVILLWDMQTRKCLGELLDHRNRVRGVTFSPTQPVLASASEDETIKLWDMDQESPTFGNCLTTMRIPRPYEGTNITEVQGLTASQIAELKVLGAIEDA
jgi:WD40 repeat protein